MIRRIYSTVSTTCDSFLLKEGLEKGIPPREAIETGYRMLLHDELPEDSNLYRKLSRINHMLSELSRKHDNLLQEIKDKLPEIYRKYQNGKEDGKEEGNEEERLPSEESRIDNNNISISV